MATSDNLKELQEYIKTAIELETSIATQENIIQVYQEKAESIKPQLVLKEAPPLPMKGRTEEFHVDTSRSSGEPALIMGAILFIGFGLFCFKLGVGYALITIGLGIACLLPMIIRSRKINNKNRAVENSYSNSMENYRIESDKIEQYNQLQQQQYNINIKKWDRNYRDNLSALKRPLQDTEELLSKYYSTGEIYEKYRNLPALTSIYEYFITGRCDALSGPHGAYNMYEDEVRKDLVISQLNTVIQHLEQIKQNQYMLYQEVKGIQRTVSRINYDIAQIRDYTENIMELSAISAYYAQVTAQNTEITAAYHILNG